MLFQILSSHFQECVLDKILLINYKHYWIPKIELNNYIGSQL
ncbi:unnamed protein product [Paramecium sonneborni]|uniref:Uncharacterized protein n=1 Tax=Paramecium sonneborni TaxID=65129 RepID=A0A8S1R1F9_9CILI|nr:unnamed protein product [Paramecium sonneborni]